MELILPRTIWPKESGNYKVIQIYRDNEAFLRFSRKLVNWEDQLHWEIVQAFLGEIMVEPKLIPSHNPHADYLIPILPQGTPYLIVGMGKCILDLSKKVADCFGSSVDYPLEINRRHLNSIKDNSGLKLLTEIQQGRFF